MAAIRLSVKQTQLLKKHRYILGKLASVDDKRRKKILNNAPSDLFKALNLVFKLLNKKSLNLTKSQENKIKKHKRLIHSASNMKTTNIKRKLVQHGGALGAILSTVLPVLGSLFKSIF